MFSLLYVSRSTLQPHNEDQELDAIVRWSLQRNAAAQVTGALLFTGSYFAQLLEGDEAAVQAIMASIACDPRHRDVSLLEHSLAERRRFGSWSLAYSGRATFAEETARRAMQSPDDYAVRNLLRLLQELTAPTRPAASEA